VSLVLIGAPGSGKTRLGKRIARMLGTDFIDTDKLIVADHGAISDIFAAHGEAHFREIERRAVIRALESDAIVALGGGAILDADTRADLADRTVVLVTVSPEAVEARIQGAKRPLLAAGGIEAWKSLVESRRAHYESLATRTWDTSSRPIDLIAREIADWIEQTSDSAEGTS
jgi:shikimate kinase